ncbi:MAG: hypothetical protein QUV06_08420 [Cyanobium sp. CZS 48M]|nr:hypothetical protein [Cyanobium sp. CZS48M]
MSRWTHQGQYEHLKAEAKRLKQELDQKCFLQYPQVKLLAAVMVSLILWLGFPRKDGDRNDCYAVFQ